MSPSRYETLKTPLIAAQAPQRGTNSASKLDMLKSIFAFIFLMTLASTALAEEGLYEILGVSAEATKSDVKSAWKKLVLQYHPDKFMNDPAAAKAATEKLAVINAAETVIGNETLRAYYDYLSYKGKNHQRWAAIPENQNSHTLEKRFGTVEYIKIKYQEPPQFTQRPQARPQQPPPTRPQSRPAQTPPQAQARETKPEPKPSATPKPQPSATPKPTPPPEDTSKPPTKADMLRSFKKDAFTSEHWGQLAPRYLKENPVETSSAIQAQLLDVLTMPFSDTNLERIAFIVVKTFEVSDSSILDRMESLIHSRNPSFKKIGVALIHYALSEGRTQEILKRNQQAAENLLMERLNDPEKIVAERSKYAAQKLRIAVENNYDTLSVIAKLSDTNVSVKEAAFSELFTYHSFSNAELKALNQQLLNKKIEFEKFGQPQTLLEMTAIIEIFEAAPDLSAIAEEFKTYRNNILGKDLVLRSYALEKRIAAKAGLFPLCKNVFN